MSIKSFFIWGDCGFQNEGRLYPLFGYSIFIQGIESDPEEPSAQMQTFQVLRVVKAVSPGTQPAMFGHLDTKQCD